MVALLVLTYICTTSVFRFLVQVISRLLLDRKMHLESTETETLLFSAQAKRPSSLFLPSDSFPSNPLNPGEPRDTIEKALYCPPPPPLPSSAPHLYQCTDQLLSRPLDEKRPCNKRRLDSLEMEAERRAFSRQDNQLWFPFLSRFAWYITPICVAQSERVHKVTHLLFPVQFACLHQASFTRIRITRLLASFCFLYWPLWEELGARRGKEKRKSVSSADYYLSPRPSGCVLSPSGCW